MDSPLFIGIDSSCYTTSVACVDNQGIVCDNRTVLCVNKGERGLRQSDGVFQHTRNFPTLTDALFSAIDRSRVASVAVSCTPRAAEDSYMPVFLAGRTVAAAISGALGVPLYYTTHQHGHVRAALHTNEALMNRPFLGMHISGGTTEVFLCAPYPDIKLLGGSTDLHAGQFVDRLGVRLGLQFPSGKHLEALAMKHGEDRIVLPVSVNGCDCSFSGVETKAQRMIDGGCAPEDAAYAAYDCMARTFYAMLINAAKATGCGDALLAGGVASSPLLRQKLLELAEGGNLKLQFGLSELSSDNAVGVALTGRDIYSNEIGGA